MFFIINVILFSSNMRWPNINRITTVTYNGSVDTGSKVFLNNKKIIKAYSCGQASACSWVRRNLVLCFK